MEKSETTELDPKPPIPEQNEGMVNLYTNSLSIDWTLYDVRIKFGHLTFAGQPPKLVIEGKAGVTMAWAEAKALRDSLSDLVARYESVNGEIIPPKLAPAN